MQQLLTLCEAIVRVNCSLERPVFVSRPVIEGDPMAHLTDSTRRRISRETIELFAPQYRIIGIYGYRNQLNVKRDQLGPTVWLENQMSVAGPSFSPRDIFPEIGPAADPHAYQHHGQNIAVKLIQQTDDMQYFEIKGRYEGNSVLTIKPDLDTGEVWDYVYLHVRPLPSGGQALFMQKAPELMERLIDDLDITDFQAAGILGNIGHECGGFHFMQEIHPNAVSGRGGYGWVQWTNARRDKYEIWVKNNPWVGSIDGDAANYNYLIHEITHDFMHALNQLRLTTNLTDAVRKWEQTFEIADPATVGWASRDSWAQLAMDEFRKRTPWIDPDASDTAH